MLMPRLDMMGVPVGFATLGGVARLVPIDDLQSKPAWNCWSGLRPDRSTGPPSENGTAPATRPLSYRQLKPIHGPSFQG